MGIYDEEIEGYNPNPGQQQPQKYPFVGEAYQHYGEQPGYIYDPYSDSYYPDPKVQNSYYEETGLKEKEPSFIDKYKEPLGALGIYEGIKGATSNPSGFFGGIKDGLSSLGGLFGLGDSAAATTGAADAANALGSLDLASGAPFGLGSVGTAPAAPEILGAAAPAEAGGLFGLGTAGLLAAPLAAATAYESLKGVNDIAKGKDLDLGSQAALALPTFGASFLYNPAKDLFGGHKSKSQEGRDSVRDSLREKFPNIFGEDGGWNLTLADGSKFDLGKDGGATLPGGNHYYDFDPMRDKNEQGFSPAASMANILDYFSGGAGQGGQGSLSPHFANALLSSGDAAKNFQSILSQFGLDHDQAYAAIVNDANLDKSYKDALLNQLDQSYGVGAYGAGKVAPATTMGAVTPTTPGITSDSSHLANMPRRTIQTPSTTLASTARLLPRLIGSR